MKASEIRAMTIEAMDAELLKLKEELFNLRFQQAINQLNGKESACNAGVSEDAGSIPGLGRTPG